MLEIRSLRYQVPEEGGTTLGILNDVSLTI